MLTKLSVCLIQVKEIKISWMHSFIPKTHEKRVVAEKEFVHNRTVASQK